MAPKRFIDLSISIEPELPSDPPMMIPKIDYINHESGAEQMKAFYSSLEAGPDRYREGDGQSVGTAAPRCNRSGRCARFQTSACQGAL